MKTTITRRSFLRAMAVSAVVPALPLPKPFVSAGTTISAFSTADIKSIAEKLRAVQPELKPEAYYAFSVHTDILYGIKKSPFLIGNIQA